MKAQSWWDVDRWDSEFGDTLAGVAKRLSGQAGAEYAQQLGLDPGLYNAPRTYKYLEAMSLTRAKWINAKTLAALEAAQLDDVSVADVYKDVQEKRSRGCAAFVAAVAAGWLRRRVGNLCRGGA